MRAEDFSKPTSPGRLEPTTFTERPLPGSTVANVVHGVGYVPHDLPAGLDPKKIVAEVYDQIIAAERNLSTLEGYARRVTNPALLLGPFARKEAEHSSAIENTFASAEQIALFDVDASSIDAAARPDVQEVSNYLAALQHGWMDKRPICMSLIKEMHERLLAKSTRIAGQPGEFRTTQNAIGSEHRGGFQDAKFVPPPPQFLLECLHKWEAYIHAKDQMPDLVRAALVHYQFECIHPFDDGNGRLGRLLVSLSLSKHGQLTIPLVYTSSYFHRHRSDYYRLLNRISSDGEWLDWIRFFLRAIETQAADAQQRTELLYDLHEDYLKRVQVKRWSPMHPKVIDRLFNRPAITIATVAEIAGTTPQTAGLMIKQLCDKGILTERTGRKSSRIFVATELLDLMKRDLERPPPPPTPGTPT